VGGVKMRSAMLFFTAPASGRERMVNHYDSWVVRLSHSCCLRALVCVWVERKPYANYARTRFGVCRDEAIGRGRLVGEH
jgi:hypothetical protein